MPPIVDSERSSDSKSTSLPSNRSKKHSPFLERRFKNNWYLTDPQTNKQKLPNDNIVDWNRGLLQQLNKVDKYYEEWIEHPRMTRAKLFDNKLLESLTFTPWYIVPLLYIPWSLLELRQSYIRENSIIYNNLLNCIIVYIIGMFSWTLFEYWCHRKAFHWNPPTPKWNLVHFLGHGLHHITPLDEFRLVFPPVISIPLGLLFMWFYGSIFPTGINNAFWGGFVMGYVLYESTHFYSHHNAFCSYLEKRHLYHSQHHFHPQKKDSLYGVSSQFWDHVFGTFK